MHGNDSRSLSDSNMKLKEILKNKLSGKEFSILPRSFDIIGDIAIFNEFPSELTKKEKIIARALIKLNPHIKVVCKKVGRFSGKYRTPKLKIIHGEKRKETTHIENGIKLKLNVEKCYFSPRLAGERLRIAKLVKPKESVLVSFSGVAVYPLVISKNSKAKEIYGIEINPIAHKYALENLKLNKINNISLIKGDLKKVLPKLNKKFDRIILPLPKNAEDYLKLTLKKLKRNGIIHLYKFEREENLSKVLEEYKSKFKHVKLVKCGEFGPRIYRICLDIKQVN